MSNVSWHEFDWHFSINLPLKSINLIPSGGGVFEFQLNEKLLFSKKELGRHSEDGEILKLIEEELGWVSHLI